MHNLKMGLSKSCIATQEEFGVEIDQLFQWPITKFFVPNSPRSACTRSTSAELTPEHTRTGENYTKE